MVTAVIHEEYTAPVGLGKQMSNSYEISLGMLALRYFSPSTSCFPGLVRSLG